MITKMEKLTSIEKWNHGLRRLKLTEPVANQKRAENTSSNRIDGNGDLNVLNTPLELCSSDPLTGFTRNGYCETNEFDQGTHLMCASVTQEFLDYTKSLGNDLSTPKPQYRFPGLKPGDNWCLCVYRWYQAKRDGVAPNLVLPSTNRASLDYLQQWDININDLSTDTPLNSCNKTTKTDL